jgi:hypothetical protein
MAGFVGQPTYRNVRLKLRLLALTQFSAFCSVGAMPEDKAVLDAAICFAQRHLVCTAF